MGDDRVFIDSNIPMYVAGKEHPNKESSRLLLEQVRNGELPACTSTEVLQEILYRYAAIGQLSTGFRVYDLFTAICPDVLPVTLADTDAARRLLAEPELHGLPVRDALHAAVMRGHGLSRIASHDKHFNRVAGLTRLPGSP